MKNRFWFRPLAAIVAIGGVAALAAFVLVFLSADEPPSTPAPTQDELPLAQEIGNLPLGDPLVLVFPKEWVGPGERPYGAFYDPAKFDGVPIKERWDAGLLHIQADPGYEFLGEWFKFDPQKTDWSKFRQGSLALRFAYSDQMYRTYKVEAKKGGDQKVIWIVNLSDAEVEEFRRRGFGDVLLPLSDAETPADLNGIDELVLVFEGQRVETVAGPQTKGELKLHSVRIVNPKGSTLAPDARIDDLARRAFDWFEHYRNQETGLVPDRAPNQLHAGVADRPKLICSIASVGYYLSMLPDAVATGRLAEDEARRRALTVLSFLEENADHHHGLLYHFIDMQTGKAVSTDVEVSALDSAILFNGCIVAGVRFGGETAEVANRLIDRADWSAFRLAATRQKPELLAMGWKQDAGLLGPMDVRSTEFLMPYLLAVGAEKNPVDPQLWRNTKVVEGTVAGRRVLNPTHGLFTSYYGLGWCRLEGRVDPDGVDFWSNAIAAAQANRDFSRAERSPTYAERWGGWWGISAGDSPRGYIAPGTIKGDAGGAVWPVTALAALPWAEEQLRADLKAWQTSPVWSYIEGPYGLAPFNLDRRWVGKDLIGIDLGSFYLAVANHRRGTVWDLWKQHPVAQRAMERLYPAK